jgi:hypothetical protein
MESVSALDIAGDVLGNFDTRWLTAPNKLQAAGGNFLDEIGASFLLTDNFKDYLSTRSAGMSAFAKQASEEIHRLTGAQMSALEREDLLKGIPNEDDGPLKARGKLLTLYNTLAMIEARHKYFLARGIQPTDKDFDQWNAPGNKKEKAAVLSQYGYTPITLKDIDKMIGANLGGEQKVGAPDAGPISQPLVPDITPEIPDTSKLQPADRTNAWMDYARKQGKVK